MDPARRLARSIFLVAGLVAVLPRPAIAAPAGPAGDAVIVIGDQKLSKEQLTAELSYEPAPLMDKFHEDANFARLYAVRWFQAELFAKAAEEDGFLKSQPGLSGAASNLGRNLIANEYVKGVVVEEKPTETEIETFYKMNKEVCTTPERVHLARLGVEVASKASPEEVEGAKKRLAAMQARLAKGDSFADVADELSDLPSRGPGGDVGWLTVTELSKDEGSAGLAKLEVGKLSEVIQTRRGFEIFRMVEKDGVKPIPMAECQPLLIEKINKEYATAASQKRADELVKRFGASMNLDAFIEAAKGAKGTAPGAASLVRELEPAKR